MGLRKAIGIIAFSTQAVVVVDYNMQSHKAGLQPGELSMKDYAAIVQQRYENPDSGRLAAADLWTKTSEQGSEFGGKTSAAQELAETPTPVCIRRGTALNCQ